MTQTNIRRSRWGTPAERLAANTVRKSNGCLEWTGTVNNGGYGQTWANGQQVLAHRLAYELENGPIPDGMKVLHRCDNPPCCDPAHHFLGTDADNTADMVSKGRSRMGEHQRSRTHCPKNHPYDAANTYVKPDGRRVCRTCKNDQQRARRRNEA
jgi:hypothetical protein